MDAADKEFLHYARTRDPSSCERLLSAHLDAAFRQSCRYLGHAADAEDAVQEAFVELVRSAHRYDGSVPFAAWFGRLVYVACRRARRKRRGVTMPLNDVPEPAAPVEIPAEALRSAVERLPERHRAAIVLHYFGGLDSQATAAALGLNASALRVRLHRGREQLRSLLAGRQAISEVAIVAALTQLGHVVAPPDLLARVMRSADLVPAPRTYVLARIWARPTLAGLAAMFLIGIALTVTCVAWSPPWTPRRPAAARAAATRMDSLTDHPPMSIAPAAPAGSATATAVMHHNAVASIAPPLEVPTGAGKAAARTWALGLHRRSGPQVLLVAASSEKAWRQGRYLGKVSAPSVTIDWQVAAAAPRTSGLTTTVSFPGGTSSAPAYEPELPAAVTAALLPGIAVETVIGASSDATPAGSYVCLGITRHGDTCSAVLMPADQVAAWFASDSSMEVHATFQNGSASEVEGLPMFSMSFSHIIIEPGHPAAPSADG